MSRALVSESSSLFREIQRPDPRGEPLAKKDVIRSSRKYRSIVHAITAKFNYSKTPKEKVIYNQIEIVWHLCEILFVDFNQIGVLLNQLLTWVRWHHPSVNESVEIILNSSSPHQIETYWDMIMIYVLRGETETARNLLKLHPDSKKDENFIIVGELLSKMPVYSSSQILYEFVMRWQAWSSECQTRFAQMEDNEQLRRILGILAGDVPTFKEILHLADSWYHFMISLLLYTDPSIKENDISVLSKQCLDIYLGTNPDREPSPFDSILLAAFDYDLMQVITECSTHLRDNWWFVTHFVDLLYNGNILSTHEIVESEKLREYLVLEYANSLMTHHSLWQISVIYFDSCTMFGKQQLELNLKRVPLDSEKKALKIVELAGKRGFKQLAKSTCKIIARKWLASNRLGSALIWAVKSEDIFLTTHLADLYLKMYAEEKRFPDEDALFNLGSSMLICDRLIFLGKYCEFHQLKQRGELAEAGQVLVSLLSSKISPNFFFPALLTDSIILLEAEKQVLNTEQTFQILSVLEDYGFSLEFQSESNVKAKYFSQFKEKEDLLRLAISRNLSRSIIADVTL